MGPAEEKKMDHDEGLQLLLKNDGCGFEVCPLLSHMGLLLHPRHPLKFSH